MNINGNMYTSEHTIWQNTEYLVLNFMDDKFDFFIRYRNWWGVFRKIKESSTVSRKARIVKINCATMKRNGAERNGMKRWWYEWHIWNFYDIINYLIVFVGCMSSFPSSFGLFLFCIFNFIGKTLYAKFKSHLWIRKSRKRRRKICYCCWWCLLILGNRFCFSAAPKLLIVSRAYLSQNVQIFSVLGNELK